MGREKTRDHKKNGRKNPSRWEKEKGGPRKNLRNCEEGKNGRVGKRRRKNTGGMWKNTGGRWKKDRSPGLNDEKKSVRRLSTENFDNKERETPPGSAHRDGKKGGENNKKGDGLSKRQAGNQDGPRDSRPAGERRTPGPSDQKTGNRGQYREVLQRQRLGQGRRNKQNGKGNCILYRACDKTNNS